MDEKDQTGVSLGQYRLVGKRLVSKDRLELLFEAAVDYILPSIRFFKEGQNSIVIVPIAMDSVFTVGRVYTLEARDGELTVKP
jgi:hypothetical protein